MSLRKRASRAGPALFSKPKLLGQLSGTRFRACRSAIRKFEFLQTGRSTSQEEFDLSGQPKGRLFHITGAVRRITLTTSSFSSVSLQFRLAETREAQIGSRPHTVAKAETKDSAQAFRRAFDWQQRCRLRSVAEHLALRPSPEAARSRPGCAQRPCGTIANDGYHIPRRKDLIAL